MAVGRNRKKGSRRRKIRISGQLRDFDELRTLKSTELKIGQAGEKDYKNLRWRYKKNGDVEFVEDDDNLADDDIVFGGSKSDIRRIEDLERNISVLATKLMTTDGAATDSDDDNFGTVVNKKTRFKDDVRFTGSVDFDDNILVLNKDVSGTPSENAGLEIRRGTSTNAKLLWNETSDHWEIASGGTTGRILTTGDSVGSSIFTTDGQKKTHDGTQVEFDLDTHTASASNDTGATNVSGQTLTLSGASFTADSRGIFFISNTNHGSQEDVIIRTNGTGASTAGFANPSGATSLFGFRGFSNTTSGVRFLTTADIDTSSYLTLEFYLIQGNSSNGGEATDANDNMVLQYSANGGNSYTALATYLGSPRSYTSWTKVMVTLPSGAKASSVRFRWYNTHTASGDFDHWGVSLVRLHDGVSVSPSFTVSNNGTDTISASAATLALTANAITLSGNISTSSNISATGTTTLSTVDINGGSIDGVNIGVASRGNGNFNSVYLVGATPLTFEGATANSFETRITVTDPTADRTITLPDETGTVSLDGGWKKLGSSNWTSDTGYADFTVVDPTKYRQYKVVWWISHQNTANSGTQWTETAAVFLTSGGEVTEYDNNVTWRNSANTTESINSTSYAGSQSAMWLAGNGSTYDSHGEALFTVPNNANFRAAMRGNSQLIGAPRQGTTAVNYLEEMSSVAYNQDPTAITGIRIRSWNGTSYTSQAGNITIFGMEM